MTAVTSLTRMLQDTPCTIGMAARITGLRVSTIRFYEKEGLIGPPTKGGGPRHYDAGTLMALRHIRLAQRLGLALKDIRELRRHPGGETAFLSALQSASREKLAQLTLEIGDKTRLKHELSLFLVHCGDAIG